MFWGCLSAGLSVLADAARFPATWFLCLGGGKDAEPGSINKLRWAWRIWCWMAIATTHQLVCHDMSLNAVCMRREVSLATARRQPLTRTVDV
ncbi:hypothetical protein V8C26DRAFT_384632 [Trichoderma gracile]